MASAEKNLSILKADHLESDENVIAWLEGVYETSIGGNGTVRNGVLTVTEKKVAFFAKKLMGYDFESINYDKISSIEKGKSMMGKSVTLHTSGNKIHMKWINKGEFDKFVSTVEEKMGKGGGASPAAPADDIPAQIQKLASLREQGVLTDAEFDAKKAELLSRM